MYSRFLLYSWVQRSRMEPRNSVGGTPAGSGRIQERCASSCRASCSYETRRFFRETANEITRYPRQRRHSMILFLGAYAEDGELVEPPHPASEFLKFYLQASK